MSGKVMGWIWDADIEDKTEKYVLLAYADHADHDGGGIFPSVSLIAWKTGISDRHVIRVKGELIKKGYLVQTGTSQYQTPIYRIIKSALPGREEWRRKQPGRKENTPDTSVTPDTVSPLTNGAIPLTSETNTPDTSVTQTVIKPSNEPSFLEQSLFDELAKLLNLSKGLIPDKMARQMGRLILDLEDEGAQAGDIEAWGEWYRLNDWRGQKDQKPTLDLIRTTWNDAKQNGNGKVVTVE